MPEAGWTARRSRWSTTCRLADEGCPHRLHRSPQPDPGRPDADRISTGQARNRRTVPTEQLTLALQGRLDAVFGYSFILTNIDIGGPEQDPEGQAEKLAEVEW